MDFVRLGVIVLLVILAAVEFSVWMVYLGWVKLITIRVCHIGTISLDMIKSAANSASLVEDMTNLIIWDMVSTGPLKRGVGSFS